MRTLLIAAAAAVCLSTPAAAQQPPPPRLLVVISVDQLASDLWDEYRPHFTGGLARLSRGTVFRNGYQSHAATETCPGHSTILTGVRPARSGIVANGWFSAGTARTDKSIYCAEDESVPGTNSSKYQVSPAHLRVPTLGDLLKRASPASLNVAVAGKDRSAVMMGGHSADQRWYTAGTAFATDRKGGPVPVSVTRANAAIAATLAKSALPLDPPALCAGKAQVYPIPRGGKPLGAGRFARAAGDGGGYRASPESDGAVLALSAALVAELGLGRDAVPDVLSIGLAATDYVGHSYGTGGQEMCLQLMSLDRDLGDFLAQLDRWNVDYAVALTADHGGLDIPERLRAKGVAGAEWIDPALTTASIGKSVAGGLGLKEPLIVSGGPSGDIYLNPALTPAERARAMSALIAAYRANPQVEAVLTKSEIAAAAQPSGDPKTWPLLQRIRASFDAERSGDLYVVLKPHIQPIADTSRYVSTHGSPWDYDRRVPIIFWRPGFRGASVETSAETADLMPTLAALVGLPLAAGAVDGRCLPGTPAFCPIR